MASNKPKMAKAMHAGKLRTSQAKKTTGSAKVGQYAKLVSQAKQQTKKSGGN